VDSITDIQLSVRVHSMVLHYSYNLYTQRRESEATLYKTKSEVSIKPLYMMLHCTAHNYYIIMLHYVRCFLWMKNQVDGFLRVLQFPTPIKLTATV